METLRTDVCVVGAGFAGLAAARYLIGKQRDVVVLEARDRVGGRVWNRQMSDGTVVSVGGTWIGKGQTRMVELCKELGLDTYPQYDKGETLLRLHGTSRRYSGLIPKIDLFSLATLGLAFKRLDWMVNDLPLETPWTKGNAAALDARTLGGWLDSWCNVPTATARLLLRTTMTTFFCTDPAEVSVLGALVLAKGGGSFEYYANASFTETTLIDGGAPELARRMGEQLGTALHTSTPVRKITQTRDYVEVVSDALSVRARRVIVATPPALAGRIEYDPPLPPAHGHLLRRMNAGAIIKGICVYKEPFWRKQGLTGETVGPETAIPVSIDQTPRSGSPGVLTSFAVGARAIEMAGFDAETRKRVWLDALAERLGPEARSPVSYLETDWSAEEWSAGGMLSHFAPGVLTTFGHVLHQPAGRIHWAGTERATLMHGLMEGAVRSGEHAAEDVIKTP